MRRGVWARAQTAQRIAASGPSAASGAHPRGRHPLAAALTDQAKAQGFIRLFARCRALCNWAAVHHHGRCDRLRRRNRRAGRHRRCEHVRLSPRRSCDRSSFRGAGFRARLHNRRRRRNRVGIVRPRPGALTTLALALNIAELGTGMLRLLRVPRGLLLPRLPLLLILLAWLLLLLPRRLLLLPRLRFDARRQQRCRGHAGFPVAGAGIGQLVPQGAAGSAVGAAPVAPRNRRPLVRCTGLGVARMAFVCSSH